MVAASTKTRGATTEGRRLFIGGVRQTVTEAKLRAEFEKYGPVESAEVGFQGIAFVLMKDKNDAKVAADRLADNVGSLDGRSITVKMATQAGYDQAIRKRDDQPRNNNRNGNYGNRGGNSRDTAGRDFGGHPPPPAPPPAGSEPGARSRNERTWRVTSTTTSGGTRGPTGERLIKRRTQPLRGTSRRPGGRRDAVPADSRGGARGVNRRPSLSLQRHDGCDSGRPSRSPRRDSGAPGGGRSGGGSGAAPSSHSPGGRREADGQRASGSPRRSPRGDRGDRGGSPRGGSQRDGHSRSRSPGDHRRGSTARSGASSSRSRTRSRGNWSGRSSGGRTRSERSRLSSSVSSREIVGRGRAKSVPSEEQTSRKVALLSKAAPNRRSQADGTQDSSAAGAPAAGLTLATAVGDHAAQDQDSACQDEVVPFVACSSSGTVAEHSADAATPQKQAAPLNAAAAPQLSASKAVGAVEAPCHHPEPMLLTSSVPAVEETDAAKATEMIPAPALAATQAMPLSSSPAQAMEVETPRLHVSKAEETPEPVTSLNNSAIVNGIRAEPRAAAIDNGNEPIQDMRPQLTAAESTERQVPPEAMEVTGSLSPPGTSAAAEAGAIVSMTEPSASWGQCTSTPNAGALSPLSTAPAGEIVDVALSFQGRRKLVRHVSSTRVGDVLELHPGLRAARQRLVVVDSQGFEIGREMPLGLLSRQTSTLLELTLQVDEW